MTYVLHVSLILAAFTVSWAQDSNSRYKGKQFITRMVNASKDTISVELLKEASKLENRSIQSIIKVHPPARTDVTANRIQAMVVFEAYVNQTESRGAKLDDSKYGEFHQNTRSYFYPVKEVNEPFVGRVSSDADDIRRFLYNLNNNSRPQDNSPHYVGDNYLFPGAKASIHKLTYSMSYQLILKCSSLVWYKNPEDKDPETIYYEFYRSFPPLHSVLLVMNKKNSAAYCKGSGLIFSEHGDKSQRVWINNNSSVGIITDDMLSDGNTVMPLTEEQRFRLEQVTDYDTGVAPSGISNYIKDVEEEYHRGVEQYDNVAFLILSLAAILSSTAVASVSPGREWDRIVIVLVEATVVYSFLAIVTQAMLVLTDNAAYSVNSFAQTKMNFTVRNADGSDGGIVHATDNFTLLMVGERTTFPIKLIATEIVSALAAAIVTITVIVAFWKMKYEKRPAKILPDTIDEIDSEDLDDMEETFGGTKKVVDTARTRRWRNLGRIGAGGGSGK